MLTTLLEQHETLYDAAHRLPHVADLQGRGVAIVAQFGSDAWVIRHYRRGGSVMSALGDRYLRAGKPRVVREIAASVAARWRGIATPEVKAGAWYDSGMFRRCDIATEYIPESSDLASVLFDRGGDVDPVFDLLRAIIQNGLLHRDLNLKNILIAGERAYVLDLDRCELYDRLDTTQVEAMRDRFMRSLRKWETKAGKSVDEAIVRRLNEAFHV